MNKETLTRQDLYELVWSKPMTQIAKEFGMSDVGVRKHCVKHDIPTPRVGHWAKVAHGKKVSKPPLPTKQRSADETVSLIPREVVAHSIESAAAAKKAEAALDHLREQLKVPENLPERPHKTVRALRAALRRTKLDTDGFKIVKESDLPELCIGAGSIDRVLRVLNTMFVVAEQCGYEIDRDDSHFFLVVNEERFSIRIYEIKARVEHEPTNAELKEQEQYDQRRQRNPDWYKERTVYRRWDHVPSGRLTVEIDDTNYYRWDEQSLMRRWRDRKSKNLEQYLADVFVWLEPASVLAREQRLKIEEQRCQEEAEQARRQEIRKRFEKAKKLEELLVRYSAVHDRLRRTEELVDFLHNRSEVSGNLGTRLVVEAEAYVEYLSEQFDEQHLAASFSEIGVNLDEGLVVPALGTPPEEPWYR